MPQVLAAADELTAGGTPCDVVCLTSPDLVFRAVQARSGLRDGSDAVLDSLFEAERAAPSVTVLDGHPHTLSVLAPVARDGVIASLGVQDFGQSGDVEDRYEYYGIDADTIAGEAEAGGVLSIVVAAGSTTAVGEVIASVGDAAPAPGRPTPRRVPIRTRSLARRAGCGHRHERRQRRPLTTAAGNSGSSAARGRARSRPRRVARNQDPAAVLRRPMC